MTDNKVEIEVGIEASLSGLIQRVLSAGVADAEKIERALGGSLEHLKRMQDASKMISASTSMASQGTPAARLVNATAAGNRRNTAADLELAKVLDRISRELGPSGTQTQQWNAFKREMVALGHASGPSINSDADVNRTSAPLFRQAQRVQAEQRSLRLEEDFNRAHREQRARDYVEHRRTRLNGERFEDNSMRANAAHDDRERTRRLAHIDASLRANATHDDRMRTAAIKQAEKEAGHKNANLLRAAQWEDSQRAKAEARAQKYAASMLRAGDLNGMLARGNTDGAAGLLQRARRTLSGRPGVDDQFIDGLLREAGGKVDASRAMANIKEAERELRSLFAGINKFATTAERQEILGNGVRDIASRRGLNPNVLDRTADDLEGVRGTRDRVLGVPVRPERAARPERAPGRGSSMLGRLGGRMELFADYAGISAIVGAVGYTVSQTALLEKSLATLKAISGATDGQMRALSKTIMEVGQSSTYSLQEISAAATTLAQAGYTVGEVAKVLPDITNLALASGSDLQTSTDIVSSVLTVFDMNIRESGYVADALTQALNGSKLSMDQFALGMQYAGNAAAQGGVSFEDLTAALGAMSNAGIRSGSTLGTGLTALLQEFQAPSEKFNSALIKAGLSMDDVNLQTHGLIDVLHTLEDAQINSTEGFQLFDTRAARAYSALLNNKDAMAAMSSNFTENGTAAAAAAEQMDTLLAQLTRLGNATVQFTTVFGAPVLEALKAAFGGLADLLVGMANASPLMRALGTAGVTLALSMLVLQKQALATTLTIGGLTTSFLASTVGAVRFAGVSGAVNLALGAIAAGFRSAMAASGAFFLALLANPFTYVALAIAGVVGALTYFSGESARAKNKADEFKEAAATQRAEVDELTTTIDELNKFTSKLINYQGDANAMVEQAERKFAKYGLELNSTTMSTVELAGATRGLATDLAALRLERAEGEAVALRNERRELQVVAGANVNAAETAMGRVVGSRDIVEQILSSPQWKALRDEDGVTGRDLATAAQYLERRSQAPGVSANMKEGLLNAVQALYKDGLRISLTGNDQAMAASNVTVRDSQIEATEGFREFSETMVGMARILSADLVDGRLSPEAQRRFDQTVQPSLEGVVTSNANATLEEMERSNGQPFSAAERPRRLANIIEALKENQDYRAILGEYGSDPGFMTPEQLTRRMSSLEGQFASTSPANRPALQNQAEQAYRESLSRRTTRLTSTEEDAEVSRYLNDKFGAPLSARQSGRVNTDYALNLRISNSEAELARLSAGTSNPAGGSNFVRPTSGGLTPGQGFGADRPGTRTHAGQDLIAPAGTRVNAPAGGMAIAGSDAANGNWVEIDHGGGLVSKLIHLTDAVVGLSAVATRVEQGDQVGRAGNTGTSSRGAHLHWQLKQNGTPIDPESMVGQASGSYDQIIANQAAELEAEWTRYVQARQEKLQQESSEISGTERASAQAVLDAELAQKRAEIFREDVQTAYANILAEVDDLTQRETGRALRAVSEGESDADSIVVGARNLMRQSRDIAIAAAMTMSPGRERQAKITEITQKFADDMAGLTINILETEANRAAQIAATAAAETRLGFDIRQSGINARGNANNQRDGSVTMGVLRQRDQEVLDADIARNEVRQLEARLAEAQAAQLAAGATFSGIDQNTASQDTINRAKDQLDAAALATQEIDRTLRGARASLEAMTSEAEVFRTPMDAIRGSWDAFIEQANLGRPIMNTLADGLLESFKGAKEGFKTLIVDVLSGTKSMGDAFKDLAVSILGSLLDLAAEILAQQLLTMIITSIIPGGFGGGAKTGLGGKSGAGFGMKPGYYQGGLIPRRAAGGMAPSPNRDSVMTFTQPGEFIMSKTATDFIGADTLSEMNASGNRRMKNLPTVASSMPKRVPDEVNVWVVPPNQRPPMGKKDIIAAVTDDMMMNGQTKRLIKAIQVGAM